MTNVTPNQIAVVVFPKPDELKFRAEKRFNEMGKEVPAEAVNEMLGILLNIYGLVFCSYFLVVVPIFRICFPVHVTS